MECKHCRHENRPTAQFCEQCGAPLAQRCPRCDSEASLRARFCDHCGQSLSPENDSAAGSGQDLAEGERRQATVLFSDLSGYTALSEHLDPEELDELVARIKARAAQIVERHGGLVNQFRGDQVFALFGVLVAHDDDPVRAVRAARALHALARSLSPDVEQRTGTSLRFHSGVSTGLIVSSGRDARDGTVGVTGDAVNTGARLVVLAGPDQIVIGPEVQRQVEDFFETSALAPMVLKGKSDPILAYRVERETPTQTRFEAAERRGLTRFAGREAELAVLHERLARGVTGSGQFVAVTGEAGVGKSRLAFEFRHGIDRSAVTVLEGRCQSSGMATPYLPFIDTIRRGLQLRDYESLENLHDKAIAGILATDRSLEPYIPHYLHLLSIPTRTHPLPDGLQGIALRQSLEQALLLLIAANSRQRPVVWIVEDWHWADDASVAALKRLIGLLPDHALMLIVLYRPEYQDDWGPLAHHTGIALQPLEARDTETIIRSVLNASALPDGLVGLVQERTGGNPFFTEEVATALLEQGHVVVADGQARVASPLETLDLPETVQATIRARVDRLDREARETLRVASVLGREFGKALLEQVRHAGGRLGKALQQLAAQDLILPSRLLPEPEYMFKHVLTQVVVYETLLHQQRKALHAQAGLAIETLYPDRLEEHYEALAHHFSRSVETEKGIRYLELAGDKAAGVFSLAEARKHYRGAIALLDAQDRTPEARVKRIDITLKLAKASHYASSEETVKTLEVARDYAQQLDDKHRMAKVAYWMGGVYRMLGNHPKVFAVLGQCMQLAEGLGDEELVAFSLHVMGRACYLTGDYAKGIRYMEQGIPISERLGNLEEVSYSYGFCGDCHAWLGNFDRAIPLVERSMKMAVEIGDIQRQAGSNWYVGAVYCMQGDWEKGLAAATRCSELARRIGGAYLIGAGTCIGGWATFMLGERERGAAMLEEGFQLIQSSGSLQGTGLYASMVADHLVLGGLGEKAIVYANKALAFQQQFGEGNGEAPAYRALAIASTLTAPPDWAAAERYIDESLRAAEHWGERPHFAITLFRHAELLLKRGDSKRAREQLDQAQRLFGELGMSWWLDQTAQARRNLEAH